MNRPRGRRRDYASMSDNRVDTSRPEYSWIPFFEELARRLHENGWRNKQPKIVAELKGMRADTKVNESVDDLTGHVDPFSLISMIRTQGFDEAMKIVEAYKRIFKLPDEVQLPLQNPITPKRPSINAMFYKGVPNESQNKILWDLLEYVMSTDITYDHSNNETLTTLLNQSFNDVDNAGTQSITGALYCIQPYRFLKIDTIDYFLGKYNYRDSAQNYLDRLRLLSESENRPFPELNNEEWFVRQFLTNPNKVPVWQVRGGIGFEFVDQFLSDNYSAISFGIDDVDLSGRMSVEERDVACLNANPELKPNAMNQIGTFSRDIRREHLIVMPVKRNGTELRYGFVMSDTVWHADDGVFPRNRLTVCWRPTIVDGVDLPLPGVATVRTVRSARNELLSRIEDAERGTDAIGTDLDEESPEDALSRVEDIAPEGSPRVWVVRADGGRNTATVVAEGYIGTEWNELDLESCNSLEDIRAECRVKYPEASEVAVGKRAGMLKKFLFDMDAGDWVLTPNSRDAGTFHYGTVQGGPAFEDVDEEDVPVDGLPCRQRRPMEWREDHVLETGELPRNAWINGTVYELRGETRDAFLRLIGDSQTVETIPAYSIGTMIEEGVFLERDELERIMAQLERKQNLILQGPPGTGKTFLARKLAYALMGERADERIANEHFHQSYAYEDFVGGYRPGINDDKQLVFESRDGAFIRLCRRARVAPSEHKYVMIIDEINRGNLSRVFGELLMLIEADKRSPEHAVELQYRMDNAPVEDGTFYVPSNVYIIGMMNLADKSLTGMNIAMRRRFAFAELRPQFHSDRFATWIAETGMPGEMLKGIIDRMATLNKVIADDPSSDRQYAIGHSFFCPPQVSQAFSSEDWDAWYRDVVEYEIRPLLEEYWFDAPDKAKIEADNLINDLPFGDGSDVDVEITDVSGEQA